MRDKHTNEGYTLYTEEEGGKGEIRSKQDAQTECQPVPTCFLLKHHDLSEVSKKQLNCIPDMMRQDYRCVCVSADERFLIVPNNTRIQTLLLWSQNSGFISMVKESF